MKPADKEQFEQAMEMLCAIFGKESTEAMLAGYWVALQDVSLQDFLVAAKKAMSEYQFMPKPGELRGIDGNTDLKTQAGYMWISVVDQIGRTGSYGSPDLDDKTMAAIRAIGGWRTICAMSRHALDTRARQAFIDAYSHMRLIERNRKAIESNGGIATRLLPEGYDD